MAMIDYGAVVKKNGRIISDLKGDLFQNFSTLKYKLEDEEPFGTRIDETIVDGVDWDNKPVKYSMAGSCFATIGDEHFLIGFYKGWVKIAIDKKLVDNTLELWEWFKEHVKPLKFTVNNEIDITISLAQKEHTKYGYIMDVYLAKFTYNGDNYEVLFGYGVDLSLIFTFTDKNYYHHKRKDYWHKIGNHYIKRGNYLCRKGLKFIREWTYNGLNDEDKQLVDKLYKWR